MNMRNQQKINDLLFEHDLQEVAGNVKPPDLSSTVLEQARMELDTPLTRKALPSIQKAPRRVKRSWPGIIAAAASVLIGIGLIFWSFIDEEKVHVLASPHARYLASSQGVVLNDGWLLVTPESGYVHAGQDSLKVTNGRCILGLNDTPNPETLASFSSWLSDNDMEELMLRSPTQWIKGTSAALLILAGSASFNGMTVNAQDVHTDVEVKPTLLTLDPSIVRNVADMEALPSETRAIRGVGIGDTHLEFLERFDQLEYLDLRNCNITEHAIPVIKHMDSIKTLDLRGCPKLDMVKASEALSVMRNLGTLGFDIPILEILPVELASFPLGVWKKKNPTGVALTPEHGSDDKVIGYTIHDEVQANLKNWRDYGISDTEAFANIIKNLSCESYMLNGNYALSDDALEAITSQANIVGADISMSRFVGDRGVRALAKEPNLTSINLSGNRRLSDAAFAHLARSTSLHNINASNTSIDDAGLYQLTKLKNLKQLVLTESNERISNQGYEQIGRMEALETLELGYVYTHVDAVVLDSFAKLKNLKTLSLHTETVTKDTFERIFALTSLESLTFIADREEFDIDEDSYDFSYITAMSKLRNLDLRDNGSSILKYKQARQSLPLSLTRVRGLWLEEGETMDDVKRLTNLKELVLDGNDYYSEGVEAFRIARPTCNVTFYYE